MEKKYIDFMGNEIKIGSSVIFIRMGFRELRIGKVIRFTPTMAVVKYMKKGMFEERLQQLPRVLIVI